MPRQGGPQKPAVHNAAAAREKAMEAQKATSEAAADVLARVYAAMAQTPSLEATLGLLDDAQRLTAADCAVIRLGVAAWCLSGEIKPSAVDRLMRALETLQDYRHNTADAHAAPKTLLVPFSHVSQLSLWDSDEVMQFAEPD